MSQPPRLKKKIKRSEMMRFGTKWMFRGILVVGILLVGIASWVSSRLWLNSDEHVSSTNKSQWTVDDGRPSPASHITKKRLDPPKCLQHEPVVVNATRVKWSNHTKPKLLEPFTVLTMAMPNGCGPLRRDWRDNPPLSPLAQRMMHHQSNCSMPVATFYLDNLFGIGSHIALWSQAMCHAWDQQVRLRTDNAIWLWMDQYHCNLMDAAQRSPLLCYFPTAEFLCGAEPVWPPTLNVSDPRNKKASCSYMNQGGSLSAFRAATTEYLFRSISPLVIEEAQRQIGVLFGPDGVPDDLITVHIRWGDKFFEMKLAIIDEYLQAISRMLVDELGRRDNSTANIYLATEDPRAVQDFMAAAPPGWKIYVDRTVEELNPFRPAKGNRASWTAKNTHGRAGLLGLAALLVSMEANYFILTTGSNWSRMMNHLRTNIIDPRCNNCTKMIDLRPGLW